MAIRGRHEIGLDYAGFCDLRSFATDGRGHEVAESCHADLELPEWEGLDASHRQPTGDPVGNRPWDDVLAATILDRLLHRSFTLMTQGESYRLKQEAEAQGLLGRAEKSN